MKTEINEGFVNALHNYGLTTYEARAYYVLLTLSEAGAGAIAKLAGIPQQRIYDTLSSLEHKGFIQVKHTNPKKYAALSIRHSLTNRIRQLRVEFNARIEKLKEQINEIENYIPKSQAISGNSHVWGIEGEEAIISRIIEMISSAQREVRLAGDHPLFTLKCKGVFQRYLAEGVALYALGTFKLACKKEIESAGGKIREAKIDYHYILIIDGMKLLLVYFDEESVPSAIYTENEDIVKPHLHHFDTLWNNGIT